MLAVGVPAGNLDLGMARLTSTCKGEKKAQIKQIIVSANYHSSKTHHFAVDGVLLYVAHLHRAVLHLEHDETEAAGLVGLPVEHHLRGNHATVLLEIGAEFGCSNYKHSGAR